MKTYIASMYRQGSRRAGDCLGDYFATRDDAAAAAREEIARVAAMPIDERDPTIDWAHRFTVRAVSL